ncbi:MAG: DUF3575 domain-containing protein [Bacteroidales bacterium]|nr:DUF3575 domain-containing protein [Bacteroidales bacterium]
MKTHHILLTVIACMIASLASAQVQRDSVKVYFRQGKSDFDAFYEGNARRLTDFTNKAKVLQRDTLVTLDRVMVIASSSPEGSTEVNEKLAYNRANKIADYLHQNIRFDENAFEVYFKDLDWDLFERLVEEDHYVPMRRELLGLIREHDLKRIKVVRFQRTWDYLLDNIFPEMRSTLIVFEYRTAEAREAEAAAAAAAAAEAARLAAEQERARLEAERRAAEEEAARLASLVPPPLPDDDEDFSLDLQEARPWSWYVKTNLLGLALLDANLAFEFEMGRHMSISLPFYYSAWDWFTPQTKFRVVGTQPELRFWFRDNFSGPFIAAHGTVAWYNIALPNAEYRIQDRDGRNPAYGAGLNFGWKFRLDRNRRDRWGLELSAGGGWLHLDYDVYYNMEGGRLVSSEAREYYGLDHASIAITYRFGR